MTSELSRPYDVIMPVEAKRWQAATRDRYIEHLCIWSDGGPITPQLLRDAREAAWREEGE